MISIFVLTGCFHYAPKSVDYNGKKYVNGWYCYGDSLDKNLYPCGLTPTHEDPLFKIDRYDFWITDKFSFDILYAEFDESQFRLPDVYVSYDELDAANNFYHDKNNYDYYIGLRFDDDSDLLIESIEEKQVLDYTIDIIAGLIHTPTITTQEEVSKHNLAVHRKSKDGLFMTHKEELVAYNQEIFFLKEFNGRSNTYTLYKIGEYGKTLYSMFEKYNLI